MKRARRLLVNSLLCSAMYVVIGGAQTAASGQIIGSPMTKVVPNLTVRGDAQLMKPADQLQISIGVVTENPDAQKALDKNSNNMRNIVEAMEKLGLSKDEYKTGRFQIRPKHSRPPPQHVANWRPEIIGYEVTNTVLVRTKRLDLAGGLIEAANKAGANSIDSIRFGLADERKFRAEAISNATTNALADARTLAESAGVKLVRKLSINLDNAGTRPPPYVRMHAASLAAAAETGRVPPIIPGDVTVAASVTIVFEVGPQ